MTKRKPFKELDLSNAFLFAAALQDEETCQLVLETILGIPIGKVKVKAEHSILFSSDFRSIRLDIYASDHADVQYDVEMQNEKVSSLPKRSRYYHAVMDVSSLKPGQGYEDLGPSYVIFICTFDPLGKCLYRYTFEDKCIETGLSLGDESKTIFLSTKGKNAEDIPQGLIHFLQYVEQSTDTFVEQTNDEIIKKLHEKVKELKKNHDLEERYMKFEELLERREAIGRQAMLQQLIQKKLAKGKTIPTIAEELEEDISTIESLLAKEEADS